MLWTKFVTALAVLVTLAAFVPGCSTSSEPVNKSTAKSTSKPDSSTGTDSGTDAANSGSDSSTSTASSTPKADWSLYPDIPKIEIMTEVDGIKIPRLKNKGETLQMTGKIPADVGNTHAQQNPSEPTTGGTLTVRLGAEPKVLNMLTESSAVQKYMIYKYVSEGLARQNMETFEWEPHIASRWIVEDSVKLSPDYPGHERRITKGDGAPAPMLELDYVAPPESAKSSASGVAVRTLDASGQPIGRVWVGIYPVGNVPGAAKTGYHVWSDPAGKLEIGGIPTGKYQLKVGAEIYGKTDRGDDGSLQVTPATEQNPLNELLKSASTSSLTLKSGEWTDMHEQTCFTYYLRDDVKWSDGTPFTTKDIAFGYALLNSKYVDCDPIRPYYQDLIECQPFGPQVIRLRYRQQYFMAPDATYDISAFSPPFHFFAKIFEKEGRELTLDPVPEGTEEEATQKKVSIHGQTFGKFFNKDERYNRAPLGTGPYVVDKWVSTDRVEVVRNKNYWNSERAGHVDRIIFKFIPDQVSALAALKAGEIDFFYDMSPEQYFEDWPNIDKARRDDYVQAAWYSPMYRYFGWNFLAPQFQDRRVRIALAMLFDRQSFIDTKLHGAAIAVSGTQYYFGPAYDREVAPIGYDPEAARDLLAAAGWIDTDNDGILDRDGKKFEFTMVLASGRPIDAQQCEVLQKNVKSVGIDMKIQPLEWASFIEKVRSKECDATTLRWVIPHESDPYQVWHGSGAGRHVRSSNAISFNNQQANELIEMLRITLDKKKRQHIHWALHRLLDSEQPYAFLWIPKDFGAYHKRIRNVKWYRLRPGFDLSEWYVPTKEQAH